MLHTADCHLGTHRTPDREEDAFARLVDLAIRESVDVVLVTGDLFDHARVPESLLDWTADQLDRIPCPTVLLPGNHDAYHAQSVHRRLDAPSRCREVLLLDDDRGSTVTVPGVPLVVWGRAMVEHEPKFRPLADIPGRSSDSWCVVAGHGLVVDGGTHRSSPIQESELDAVDWDYVGLGHCHVYTELRDGPVVARYSGATAASRQQEPGAVIVDFVPERGAIARWVALDD